jgi:hypothetical protein
MIFLSLHVIFLSQAPIDGAIFHYEIHLRRGGNVGEPIAGHGYNIGESIPCDQPAGRTMSSFVFNDAPRFEIVSPANQIPDPSLGIAETREPFLRDPTETRLGYLVK